MATKTNGSTQKMYFGLSRLNPDVKIKTWCEFWGNFGAFQKIGLSRPNPKFWKKTGLRRLNPNF